MTSPDAQVSPPLQLVTLTDIERAAERIRDLVVRTPLLELPHPTDSETVLWCKPESLQPTGAFKLRGAYNAIAQSLERARGVGIVAQSSGNHGRAVAWLARRLGLRAVIVMPDAAPAPKVAAVRDLGAEVELVNADRRDVRPHELVAEHGYVFVPPYDHPHVIAGQGTVGLELVRDLPDLGMILVPVSGGGLIAGVSTAVKMLRPDVTVLGVEPELAADAQESLRRGRRVTWPSSYTYRTVADGLRTTALGVHTFAHLQSYVDDIVTVSEDQISDAMRYLALSGRLVVEPAGAAAVAAWHHGYASPTRDSATAAVVSGGSVNPELLTQVLTPREEVGRG